jgi:hypothetical protein
MTKIFKAHKPKPRGASPKLTRARPSHDDERPGEGAAAKPAGADGSEPKEIGGPSGPEPTRYGDWERKGICVDF